MGIFSVYKIENKVNHKVYIGKQSSKLKVRWDYHKWSAKAGKKTRLARAIREFGEESFTVEILFECDSEQEIKAKEVFYIQQFRANEEEFGYNMTCGSQGGLQWSIREIKKCAAQYKTRTEWARGHPNSYDVANYHGWVEECSKHMPIPKRYTEDEVRQAASAYTTPNEWKKGSRGTYDSAKVLGIRKDIVSRMTITKIKGGRPILVDGVFYKNAHAACTELNLNHGNVGDALIGKRTNVKGHKIRYVTKSELHLYVDNHEQYDPSMFDKDTPDRKLLILWRPIINQTRAFCGSPSEVGAIESVDPKTVSHALRHKGVFREYTYATKQDLIDIGVDPLSFKFFFVQEFPGFLRPRKKRQTETSTPIS